MMEQVGGQSWKEKAAAAVMIDVDGKQKKPW